MINLKNILVLITALLPVACSSTEKEPSAAVKAAFGQKFEAAEDVEWGMEADNEWEAEFRLEGKEYSANFSSEGDWLETEYEVEESEVPLMVENVVDTSFAGYLIESIEMTENAAGAAYEFVLEKGVSDIEVIVSPTGEILKNEVIREEELDDDGE